MSNSVNSESPLTVKIYKQEGETPQQHNIEAKATVEEDMLVIGGGAVAKWTGSGALLTASYPVQKMNAWSGSSKDHMVPERHRLDVYAIGLKIQSMTRDELLSNIYVATSTSGVYPHPEATATLPSGYLVLGGGFRVDWHGGGNLATASFPSSYTSWTVRSKDHEVSDPASITAYAIGIRRDLPVGTVETHIQRVDSSPAQHPLGFAGVLPGFTLTGGGAQAHWRLQGNLLWKLAPTEYGFEGGAKDHDVPEVSVLSVYSVAMRII